MYALETEKLTKYYGRARGIVDLDLKVESGEYFGFIGPNGAGKSTTIRSLLGLIRPTSGKACVLGLDGVKILIGAALGAAAVCAAFVKYEKKDIA